MKLRETIGTTFEIFDERGGRALLVHGLLRLLERKGVQFLIDDESQENLDLFDEELSRGAGILYCNHTEMLDAAALLEAVDRLPHVQKVLYAIAQRYASINLDAKKSIVLAPLVRMMSLLGLEPSVIPQEKDAKNPRAQKRIDRFKAKAVRALGRAGNLLVLTPEGTRGKFAPMTEFRPGLARFVLQYPDLSLLAVGLIPPTEAHRFTAKTAPPITGRMLLGDLVTQYENLMLAIEEGADGDEEHEQLRTITRNASDLLAFRVANLLPAELQGFYAENRKEDDE